MLLSKTIILSVLSAMVAAAPASSKIVQLPVTKHSNPEKHQIEFLQRVKSPSGTTITNKEYWYSVALSLGTPAQHFNVLLDTGSSDLWVYSSSDNQDCGEGQCDFSGTFDAKKSSTYQFLNNDFSIQYVSGASTGDWGTDTLTIGDIKLTNFQFATASSAQGAQGIIGVSLPGSESTNDQYPNFPLKLKSEGFIDRAVYSLYLDDLSSSTGTLLLGGIDTAKFEGELAVLPLTNPYSFEVAFDGISIGGRSVGGSGSATLDSGTSFTYVPEDIYEGLSRTLHFQGVDNQYTGLPFIDCNSNAPVTFHFAGKDIVVPSEQLVLPLSALLDDESQSRCVFGIQSSDTTDGYVLFGDTFLRAAYVVYDVEDKQIGIAQAKYTSASHVEPVTGPL